MSHILVRLTIGDDKLIRIVAAKYEEFCAMNFYVVGSAVKMLLLKKILQNSTCLTYSKYPLICKCYLLAVTSIL